jgi:hypothetical protein
MYHWATKSYSRHKASDFFCKEMQPLVDQFIEVMSISHGRVEAGRRTITDQAIPLIDDQTVVSFLNNLVEIITETITNMLNEKKDTDLISIKDDMLAITRQTIYLFSLE